MDYHLRHRTEYRYSDFISLSHNEARMTPMHTPQQQSSAYSLSVHPAPDILRERDDYFGNRVHFFTIERPHSCLEVTMTCRVSVQPMQVDLSGSITWEAAASRPEAPPFDVQELQYRLDSPLIQVSQALRDYAAPSFSPNRPLLEAVAELNHRIFEDFEFVPDVTDITTPLSEVMDHRSGVCQDFAQLGIGCLRAMGLAARYVSGYIETLPPPGKPKLVGSDASHAWMSVHVPGMGWVDFDPTNDQQPGGHHITVAYGRDFTDATPLKGVMYGGLHEELSVEVDVVPAKG